MDRSKERQGTGGTQGGGGRGKDPEEPRPSRKRSPRRPPPTSPPYRIVADLPARQQQLLQEMSDLNQRLSAVSERAQDLIGSVEATSRWLEAVQYVTEAVISDLPLNDLLHQLLARIQKVLGGDTATILLLTPDGKGLQVSASTGIEERAGKREPVPVGHGIAGHIVATRKPLIVDDLSRMEVITPILRKRISSLIGVPLAAQDRVIGVVHVGTTRPRHFTDDDLRLLQLVAERAAAAIVRAQAEEARSELAAIVEVSEDAITSENLEGNFTSWNPGAEHLYGYRAEEVLGKSLQIIFPPERRHELATILESLKRGERVPHYETVRMRKDGSRVDVSMGASPIRDASGEPVGGAGIARDISQRKHEEMERAQLARDLQLLLESTGEGIYGIDTEGRCTFVNRAAARMLGYDPEELLGKNMHETVHHSHRDGSPYPASECPILRAAHRGRAIHLEDEGLWRRDHSYFPAEYSSYPMREGRTVKGAVVTFRDISERKQAEEERSRLLEREREAAAEAEEQRARFQTILESAPYGIIFLERDSGTVISNSAATRLLGVTTDPHGGLQQFVGTVERPDRRPFSAEELPLARALEGETVADQELMLARPYGERVPILSSAAPVYGHRRKIIGAVVIFQDITTRKELERLREEWTSLVAHDMRQPITVITGNAGILRKLMQRQGCSPEEQRLLDNIQVAAGNLGKTVNDLLDISRLEARRLSLERQPLDPAALVQGVVERAAPTLQGHPVHVEVEGEVPAVFGDPVRLEQVLANLLSNAAKYGYPDTEIQVKVRHRGGEVVVSVRNRGRGIPPQELSQLFTRFHRTQWVREERIAGLGLGLYISRGLVEAHGGHIWAESTPGKFTTFYFTLPVARPKSKAA